MPEELRHACHNCSALDYLFADGAHAWCKRLQQVNATPATGCAYWTPVKNAELIPVPEHRTLSSADFERSKGT